MKKSIAVRALSLWAFVVIFALGIVGCSSSTAPEGGSEDVGTAAHALVPTGSIYTAAGWLDVETQYIPGVVDCELAWFTSNSNALRALAVAARTYLAKQMELNPGLGGSNYPVDTSAAFQCYRPTTRASAIQAAADTTGLTMTWGGNTITSNHDSGAEVNASGITLGPRDYGYGYDSWDSMRTAYQNGALFGGWAWTEIFVTYNEGKSGAQVTPSIQSRAAPNRGALGQYRAAYLGTHGYGFEGILHYFYGHDISIGTPAVSCPNSSIQSRVQRDSSQPWAQSITINLGDGFTVGAFKNGWGQLAGSEVAIEVNGPGLSTTASNLQRFTPTQAGTYSVRVTCGSLSETSTVTVSGGETCPNTSVQSRVQRDSSQPWAPAININLGEAFNVGAFKNGWGMLAGSEARIEVSGPGLSTTATNLQRVTPPQAGTYSVRVTCGSLSETSTVTVSAMTCPNSSIQSRVQRDSSQPWAQSITINQGEGFTVGAFKNGWGMLAGSEVKIEVSGPGLSTIASNLQRFMPTQAGTYSVRVTCGSLSETSTVTVSAPTCPDSSIQSRVQRDSSQPWAQSITINQGEGFSVGAFKNGWGMLAGSEVKIEVSGPGLSTIASNLQRFTPTQAGTYSVRVTCGSLSETSTVTVAPPASLCPDTSVQARARKDASQPWVPALTLNLGEAFTVGALKNDSNTLAGSEVTIEVTGPGFSTPVDNLAQFAPMMAGTYTIRVSCDTLSETATVTVR